MDWPNITVRAALGQSPFTASPTWTTLPTFRRASIRRGRQHSLGQFQAGTASMVMRNIDRRFDPWHTSGPYGSNIKPGTQVQIRAEWASTTYYVFGGFIERVIPRWPGPKDGEVVIELVDAFKLFEQRRYRRGHYRDMIHSYNPRLYYLVKEADGASTAEDATPNNNDGTYIGRTLVGVAGAITTDPDDRALNCGGNDGAVQGPTGGGVSGTTDCGVELLVLVNALPSGSDWYQLFDQKIVTGSPDEYVGLRLNSSGQVLLTEGSTGASILSSSTTIAADSQWHHVLWIRTNGGGTHTLHVDGVMQTPVLTSPKNYEQHPPFFGADGGGTVRMNGGLDELVVYSGAVPFSGASGIGGDALAHFAEMRAGNGAGQRTDQRIWALLDAVGWPSANRVLDGNGLYTLQGISSSIKESYLSAMHKVMDVENGFFFVETNGWPRFTPERALSPLPSSTFTLGENAGEVRYRGGGLEGEYSDEHVRNEFELTADGLGDVYLLDTASRDDHGYRTLPQSGMLFEDLADMQARAERWRQQFRTPKKRIKAVTVMAQDHPATAFPFILGKTTPGQVGTIKRKAVGGGSEISVLSEVESVSHEIGEDTWACTVQLEALS